MMGFDAVASLAHGIEDRLDLATADDAEVDPAAYATLLEDIDRLERLVRGDIPAAAPGAGPIAAAPGDHAGAAAADAPEPQAAAATAPGGAAPAAVPVRLDLLDELLRLAGESSITVAAWQPVLSTAGSATAELRRLIVRLRAVTEELVTRRSEDDTLAGSRRAATARLNPEPGEFDPLELDRYTTTDYIAHELAEIGAESHSVEREIASALDTAAELTTAERHHTSALQDRLLDARLVPLDDLATRLQRAARGVALRRGKDVDFVFEGGKVGVDRALVDSVADALIHLVRNAVDHGIELPEVRRARGKPAAGAVRILAHHEQGEAVIEVADDGAGIDARAVAAAARARGEEISEEGALAAVFRPGFTTAAQVDDVSGRGIGLDAVRDAIRRIRGTVEVATEVGRGTVFSLRFPVTLAQARVVLAVAAGHPVAVPAPAIRRVVRLADVQTERFGDQPIARLDGQGYELTQLASLLALPPSPLPANPPVLFVEAAGKRAALVADSVGTQQEVVVKGTGTHLGALRGVAGATLMQNGRVALLLHLPDLLGSAGFHTRALTEPAAEAPQAPAPPSALVAGHRALRVLVVDDSPTIRKLLVRMLKDLGWQPAEAKDGDEALEAIRLDRPDAVLADVEMPRLDGYGLLARLRERPETADLPVVMLTSRTAERHRQRARDLGANGYLTKPYRPADVVAALTAVCPEVPAAGMGVA
jgi:chemosensory pili system protein ChpA (sensor histidine kinase/response regulator)